MSGRIFRLFIVLTILCWAFPALAKAPTKMQGKLFFIEGKIADQDEKALIKVCEQISTKTKLKRQKDGHWLANAVAFFRKPAVEGPITVWLYDKADKEGIKNREPIEALSIDAKGGDFFLSEIDFNPDKGYNKAHTYFVQIGQLVNKKELIYASGEVTLEQ